MFRLLYGLQILLIKDELDKTILAIEHIKLVILEIKVMKLLRDFEEKLTFCLEWLGLAWWVKITTKKPHCTYYFGPFVSPERAEEAQEGYVEDLKEEEAQEITIAIEQLKPKELTIYGDE